MKTKLATVSNPPTTTGTCPVYKNEPMVCGSFLNKKQKAVVRFIYSPVGIIIFVYRNEKPFKNFWKRRRVATTPLFSSSLYTYASALLLRSRSIVIDNERMEKNTPVRKPHTSTADLLTWPDNQPFESPSAVPTRSHRVVTTNSV